MMWYIFLDNHTEIAYDVTDIIGWYSGVDFGRSSISSYFRTTHLVVL